MGNKKATESGDNSKQALPLEADATSRGVRWLTDLELSGLRKDMTESSAWAKAEQARRRKNKGERP
ncbi:MAG: hypothetical protein Sw2LagPseu_33770 [Shewanella algae]